MGGNWKRGAFDLSDHEFRRPSQGWSVKASRKAGRGVQGWTSRHLHLPHEAPHGSDMVVWSAASVHLCVEFLPPLFVEMRPSPWSS